MTKPQERMAVFVFGVMFIVAMLILAVWIPTPTPQQYETFKIVLALAVAGVAGFIPGFLEVNIPKVVRAGGAIGVFVLIYMNTPAQIVTSPTRRPPITWHASGRVETHDGQTGVAGADIQVDEDANAHAISKPDGSFDLNVQAWPDGQVLFRVTGSGQRPFTKLVRVGTEPVVLRDESQP